VEGHFIVEGDFIIEGEMKGDLGEINDRMESQGIWEGNGLTGDKSD